MRILLGALVGSTIALVVAAFVASLGLGNAALPSVTELPHRPVQAAPPEALSVSPLATCSALDFVSEADCLNRCLRAETDFVFYHNSDGVVCMVPCALAVGGTEVKGY